MFFCKIKEKYISEDLYMELAERTPVTKIK